ncbi:MAG: exodeoxyribonuclease VII large subunit [Gammaproteobacteria bacterium]|nr:exodeoxyribonuclease VII large subunit [Gammaproteobacteria bacterium]
MTDNIVIQNEEIISVGELNKSAKYLLENTFNSVSVIGEISNLSKPSSGHIYFTLKDEDGAIRCAMFRNQNLKLNFSPENGNQCVLKGQVSIYAARGDYQLIVKSIEPAGSGNLMQKFEALKKKLDEEGLFDKSKKIDIPSSPKHIGIITSSSTAAFQDVISTIKRRAPSAQISLSEATVQGDNAHVSIIKALNRIINFNEMNGDNKIDVVILSRGGGSIEDLWCFNNEELAREIFSFPIPTISGVGHEIDFTICDFVSDIRVPTPTASAELVTEFIYQLSDKLKNNKIKLNKNIKNVFEDMKQSIDLNKSKLKNPITLLREKSQSLDNMDARLQQNHKSILLVKSNKMNMVISSLTNTNPLSKLHLTKDKINTLLNNLNRNIEEKLKINQNNLEKLCKNIEILNPLSILDRGYAIVTNKEGVAVKSSKEVSKGEKLTARLSNGLIDIEVKNIND